MNWIERLEQKIRTNFPDISESEVLERLDLAKHLVAMEYQHIKFEQLHQVSKEKAMT